MSVGAGRIACLRRSETTASRLRDITLQRAGAQAGRPGSLKTISLN